MHIARAATLDGFEQLATGLGLDVSQLIEESGLPLNALSPLMADSYLSLNGIEKIFALAEERSGEYYLAARLGGIQKMSVLLGALGIAMQQCSTVGEALVEVEQHLSFQVTGAYVKLERVGREAFIEFVIQDAHGLPTTRHTTEFALSASVTIMKSLCGSSWKPNYIQFMHQSADTFATPDQYYSASCHFNQERNAMVFDFADLNKSVSTANPQLNAILHDYLELLDKRQDDFQLAVEKIIRQQISQGQCNVQKVSKALYITRRTLHRRLKKVDTSFTQILEEIRQDLACKMLRETDTSITQLADQLCYSDVSAFSRAFRTWFSCSPQEYRSKANIV